MTVLRVLHWLMSQTPRWGSPGSELLIPTITPTTSFWRHGLRVQKTLRNRPRNHCAATCWYRKWHTVIQKVTRSLKSGNTAMKKSILPAGKLESLTRFVDNDTGNPNYMYQSSTLSTQ